MIRNDTKLSKEDIDAYIRNTIEEYAEEIEEWAKQGYSAKTIFIDFLELSRDQLAKYKDVIHSRFPHISFIRQTSPTRIAVRKHKALVLQLIQERAGIAKIAETIGVSYAALRCFVSDYPEEFEE